METQDKWQLLEPYRDIIVAGKIKSMQGMMEYYEYRGFDREKEYHLGYTASSRLEALEKKQRKIEVEFNNGLPLEYMDISMVEALNFIRFKAHSLRRTSKDHPDNPWIKIGFLKKAVKMAQTMIAVEPRLEIYSLHWIINSTQIQLT